MVPSGECPHVALPWLPPGTRALRRISVYVAGTGLTSIVLALDSFAPTSLLSEIPVFPRAVVPVPILLPVALLHGCIALFFAYGLHRLDLCAANLGHFIYLWATGLTLAVKSDVCDGAGADHDDPDRMLGGGSYPVLFVESSGSCALPLGDAGGRRSSNVRPELPPGSPEGTGEPRPMFF